MQNIRVVFEDELLVVIHKPSNTSFHNEASDNGVKLGIVEMVRDSFSNKDLYPVHRLDKITSGLLVFAKGKKTVSLLGKVFEARMIEKYYLAVSSNKPKKKQGSIIGDMEKARNGSYLLRKTTVNPAISRFKSISLKNTESCDVESVDANWLHLFKIETGKTHQIRVALKSLGSPILGDRRYGGVESDRGYLHAYRLRFELNECKYEISDADFLGTNFSLAKLNENTGFLKSNSWDAPEALSWPKGTAFIDET